MPAPGPEPPRAVEPEPVALVWDAPPGCPDVAAVRERLATWMPETNATELQARATVTTEGDGFRLELRLEQGARVESRSVFSTDCEALARATGLVIAVAIDPVEVARHLGEPPVADSVAVLEPGSPVEAVTLPSAPRPSLAPSSGSEQAPRSDTDAPPPSARTTPMPVRFAARPELLVGGGLLPGLVGLGVAGTFAVFGRHRAWRAEIGGAYWFPRRATIADAPTAGGEIWLAHARGSGCWVPAVRRTEFPICGGLDLGVAGGRGFGIDVDTQTNADLWVGTHAGLGVAWAPVPALALFARVEGVVALRRPGFLIEGVGEEAVHRIGAAGARGTVGLEVRFSP